MSKAFEIHVRGALAQEELENFGCLAAVTVPAETILTVVIPDDSALYGVINRLQSLGLILVEVRRLDRPSRTLTPDGQMLALLEAMKPSESASPGGPTGLTDLPGGLGSR